MTTIQFEVGHRYHCRSACDHECIWTFAVIRRTQRSIWLNDHDGNVIRKVIKTSNGIEHVLPLGSYSMAPVLTAEKKEQQQRYEVLHFTICGGWINCWFIDDMPQTFASRAEAQAEIDEFLDDIRNEILHGEREPDNGYDPEDFRIEPVTSTQKGEP